MTTASEPVANFLSLLQGVKADGTGWAARCPCRSDDNNPSLHVGEGRDGRVLVTCHRGDPCDLTQICGSVGISINDLFPPKDKKTHKKVKVSIPASSASSPKTKKSTKMELVTQYDYLAEDGTLLFQKQRFVDGEGKKTFRQRRPDGDEWIYSLGDIPKVLYRLPEVLAAAAQNEMVFVVEGEKDADTLARLGHTATTMPGGAGKWLDIHTSALVGADVWVVQDNDEVGVKHANEVVNRLNEAEIAVTLVAPPEQFKDVTDFFDDGGRLEELVIVWPPVPETATIVEEQTVQDEDPLDELVNQIEVIQNKDLTVEKKLIRIRGLIDRIDPRIETIGDPGRLVGWDDFVNEHVEDSYDWAIPGVIERQDRVIVVAAEGVGKTMLARQMAICPAAGVHPFTFERMEPIRTLTVDLENPERIIRRMSTKIVGASKRIGGMSPQGAHILIRPAGMDLLNPADRIVLEEAIEKTEPDLVCLGPLYKSFVDTGSRTSEALAVDIAKYLDYLRTTYKFALWLEHHAPLGSSSGRDLRPFGSAVWSRWPEFGWTLEPDLTAEEPYVYKWGRFRNDREPRHRPVKVKRGRLFPFEVMEFLSVD